MPMSSNILKVLRASGYAARLRQKICRVFCPIDRPLRRLLSWISVPFPMLQHPSKRLRIPDPNIRERRVSHQDPASVHPLLLTEQPVVRAEALADELLASSFPIEPAQVNRLYLDAPPTNLPAEKIWWRLFTRFGFSVYLLQLWQQSPAARPQQLPGT